MRKRSKTKQVTRTKLHFIAILLLLSQLAIGQVYPVNVTGSLMMPASNNISDLGSGDASKLTYTINLNDPVENALEVYLQVVVKNNNRVIMQSNPDLKTVRRTLMRGQPLSISGSDIATLLNFNNLQGRNGFGRSNKLPKGLNAICVVAYSTLRGVPVSNEGCASGLYQDLKVPVIELPNCGSSMQLSDNQNVQFKWAPRHIGSPNAPSMVNYEIEIKEMPAGSISPADVFANATLFLKRTVTTSSFLLNDTDPKLVAGKTYAWRVRAKSATTGSYFLNDGYSEYCSFSVMSKGQLPIPSCASGTYLTPVITGVGKASAAIQAGQTVKVGYFNLEVKEVSAAGNGYNGKGLVFVPFLKANVNVSFSDLRTNKSGRAHTVGNMEATTDVENELAKILKTATPTIIDTAINRTITALVASNPKKRMTINRSVNDKTPIGLPLILGSKDVKGKSLPSLVISKIRFAARKATVDIAMSPPSAESSVKANFWKTEVPIVPSGIPANPQLDLVSNMVVPIGKGGEIAINLNTPESKATKARCDCKGFNAFAIQGKYAFPEEFVSLKDGGKPLIGSFSARSQHWGNLILEITGVEKFGFTPMEGFVFGADRVVLDFSKKLNVEKLKTPKNFGAINNEWIGIYLPKVTVTIPKSVTGSKDISFKGENMMLDDNGLFAKLSADNLLKVNEGKIGSWGFGIDSVNIDIAKSSVTNSYFVGGLQLPIMTEKEAMPYKASFVNNAKTKKYDLKFEAVPTSVAVSLLGSTIAFDSLSKIDISRENGSFSSPKVNLSGVVKFDLKPTGFVGTAAQSYTQLQKLAKDNNLGDLVPVFKSEGFKFKNFIIDFSREGSKFTIGNIEPSNSKLAFLGTTANLADVKFGVLDTSKMDASIRAKIKPGEKPLGFTFETKVAEDVLAGLAPTISLGFNLKEKTAADGSADYDFLSYDLSFGGPIIDMSCNNNLKAITIANKTPYSGAVAELKEIKVGRFVLTPDLSALARNADGSYKGTGIIKVPVLGPMQQLQVAFENLKVNSVKQMIDGSIVTKADKDGLFKDPNIKGLLGQATSKLNTYANKAVTLPVILGDPKKDGYNFTFTGIEWKYDKASLSARLLVDMGNEKYAEFRAEGLNIVPGGIAGADIILSLVDTVSLQGTTLDYPIAFDGYNSEKKSGSYVLCDCDGFQNFNLSGKYSFDKKTTKNLANPGKAVTASFSVKTDEWAAFMAEVTAIDSFAIEGIDGFTFKPGKTTLDFSKKKSVKDAKFPKGYSADESWRGLYISSIDVSVPSSFTGGTPGSFNSKNLIVDASGVSSNLSGIRIVDQKSGDLGGWAFSIDSFEMNVIKNSLVDGEFKGGMVLPIMSQEKGEFMPYVSSFKQKEYKNDKGETKKDYDMDFSAVPTTVASSVLRSKITFDKKSTITVGRKDGNYSAPKVSLTGVLEVGIEVKEGELSPIAKKVFDNIKSSAKELGLSAKDIDDLIPGLQSKGIKFEDMVIDMSAPSGQSKFSVKDFAVEKTSIKFLGSKSPLEDVTYQVFNLDSLKLDATKLARLKKDSSRVVGLTFKSKLAEDFLGGLAPTVHFGLQLEEKPSEKEVTYMALQDDGTREKKKKTIKGRSFSFFDYSLNFEKPDVNLSCRSTSKKELVIGAPHQWEGGQLDSVKVGYFTVRLSNSGGFTNGKYTGKGIVDIPVLGPMRSVNVDLKDVAFDSKKQMVSGEVMTKGKSFQNTDTGLSGMLASAKAKLIAKSNKVSLPVVLSGDMKKDGYTILFEGLVFSPTKAEVSMKAILELGGGKYGTFTAKGLNLVPKGIDGVDARLSLEEVLDLKGTKFDIPLKINPYRKSVAAAGDDSSTQQSISGSYISCDCDGFRGFNLSGEYTFDKDYVNLVKVGQPVKAQFKVTSKTFGDFVGKLADVDTFAVADLPGFEFAISGVELDYSGKESIKGMTVPKGYASVDSAWHGLYAKDIYVKVPSSFTGGSPGAFNSKHMVIDSNGFSSNFLGTKIVDQKSGNLGGWAFSIDTFSMNVLKNNLVDGAFNGGIVLPIMSQDKGEFMPYKSSFKQKSFKNAKGETKKDYDMSFAAVPTTVNSSVLRSKITFDTKSSITVSRKDGNYEAPKVSLNGVLEIGIEAKEGELSPIAKSIFANIKSSAKDLGLSAKDIDDLIPGLQSKGIRFEELVIDMNAPTGQSKFSIKDFAVDKTSIKFLGSKSPLENVKYEVYVLDSMNLDASKLARLKKDSSKVVGLTFKSKLAEDFLGGLAPTVHFGLQLEEKPKSSVVNYYSLKDDGTREKKTKTVQGRDFSFFDYSLKFEKPDVNMACRETNKKSITLGAAKNWEAGQLDSVKIGHFSVKLSGNGSMVGGKYSGMGIADIPVLGPMRSVNVELKNVTFDDQKRMIDGDVTTKGKAFANTDTGLTGLLDNAKKKLISQANQALEFPVILGGDIEKDGYSFIFDGISFKANKAELSARVVVDLGNKQLGVFEGAGMSIVPKGISGVNVRMGLKSALDLSKTELGLPLTFRAFDTKDTLGSFVACDCDGFQGFNIGGQINFPEDKLQSVKGLKDSSKKKVSASFKMNTKKWGDFMGVVTMPDTVFIPGIEDMKIHFGTAEFDYSDFRNPENFKAPEGYGTKIDNKWVGLYIPQISLRLPDAITATSEGAVPLVTASHMIFDTSGFTGVFNAQNLISMDKANIGGLGFSLDSIRIDFLKNSMKESKFLGGIQLPMMTKEEFIPYEGEFTIATDKKTNKSFLDVAFNAQPKTVKIDMFKAEFSFDSTSVINIKRENGKFAKPLIDLSGSFKIDIPKTKDAFSADALANVKAIESYLGVSDILPTFSLDSIAFKHFKLDFNSKDNVFSIGDIKPRGTGVKFMTVDWKMDEIKFDDLKNLAADAKKKVDEVKKTTKSDALGKIKNLGLEFGFKYGPVGADFRIKIDEEKGKDDKVGYKFKGFAFDVDLPDAPKFTCDTTVIVKVPEDKSVAALEVGQMVTVGRYKMKVASASGTRGKGTIKIPFLGYTMNVSFTDLTVNKAGDMLNGSIVTDTDSSLIPESAASTGGKGVPFVATSDQLDSYLKKTQEFFTLPMSISKKLKDLAKVEMPAGLDVVVVGMNFNNKAASMNLVISVPSPISDQKPYVFGIRGMDVRPDGFDLGELKMFLAKDVQF